MEEEISFAQDIRLLKIASFLYRKGHSLLKLVVELLLEDFFFFFVSRFSEAISFNQNILGILKVLFNLIKYFIFKVGYVKITEDQAGTDPSDTPSFWV